jgi:hypothetical protein
MARKPLNTIFPIKGAVDKEELELYEKRIELKKVYYDRLTFLLSTPIDTPGLKKIEGMEEIINQYNLPGATLSDVMHLVQIKKAMMGDSKAYQMISNVTKQMTYDTKVLQDREDPTQVMGRILGQALKTMKERDNQLTSKFTETIDDSDDKTIISIEIDPFRNDFNKKDDDKTNR